MPNRPRRLTNPVRLIDALAVAAWVGSAGVSVRGIVSGDLTRPVLAVTIWVTCAAVALTIGAVATWGVGLLGERMDELELRVGLRELGMERPDGEDHPPGRVRRIR